MDKEIAEYAKQVIGKARRQEVRKVKIYLGPLLQQYIPIPELTTLIVQYAASLSRTSLEEALYNNFDWLWSYEDKNWMYGVVKWVSEYNEDTVFLKNELQFCTKDVIGETLYLEDLKLYCARARCLWFKACYCGNPIPLRHWTILELAKKHRFEVSFDG